MPSVPFVFLRAACPITRVIKAESSSLGGDRYRPCMVLEPGRAHLVTAEADTTQPWVQLELEATGPEAEDGGGPCPYPELGVVGVVLRVHILGQQFLKVRRKTRPHSSFLPHCERTEPLHHPLACAAGRDYIFLGEARTFENRDVLLLCPP